MKKSSIVFIVSFYLLSSCTSVVTTNTIKNAYSLMRERPDSSLSLLRSIDTTLLKEKKWRAKYDLAHAIALDKNYIDTTDESILKTAKAYYSRHGDNLSRAQFWYYLGRIQENAKEYDTAILSFQEALEYANKTDDIRMKGMINSCIGTIHNANYNRSDELKFQLIARDLFLECGDSLDLDISANKLATAYNNNRLYDKADSLFSMIGENSAIFPIALRNRANTEIKRRRDNSKLVVEWYETAARKGAPFSSDDWYLYAYALLLTGQIDRSDGIVDLLKSWPTDVNSFYWRYWIAKAKGDLQSSFDNLEKYSFLEDSIVRKQLAQSVYRAETERYRRLQETARNEASNTRMILAIAILASLTTLLIIAFLYEKSKRRNRELLSTIQEAEHLLDLAKIKESEDKDTLFNLRSSFAKLYKNSFARIGELYNINPELSPKYDSNLKHYRDYVDTILKEVSGDKKEQAAFEKRINDDLNNIMIKLREDFPSHKEDTFRFLSYVIVGFKDSTIASLTGLSYDSVRVKKSTLRKQILDAQTPNRALYEAFIK